MSGWFVLPRRPRSAAQWFAARRAGSTPRLERRFKSWLSEHPAHAEDYALCEVLWEASLEAARRESEPPATAARKPWRPVLAAGLASLMAAAIFLWAYTPQTWTTHVGEQRTVLLADGSWVTLNTRTRIEVRLSQHARDIELREGEAYFEVAKDSARPFTVHTPLGIARAVGTQFNAYLDVDRLEVTTAKGTVFVAGNAPGAGVLVNAGIRADLRSGAPHPTLAPANLTSVLSWRAQRLDVDNAPLADVLKDFSRYTPTSIRAGSPDIAALRVSAVLRVGDLAALETTLKGAFGLRLERRGGDIVVVRATDSATPHS
jgi:transmembrane sensor